jgi:hypothetical protein
MHAAAILVVAAAIAGVARAQSFSGVVVPPVGSSVGPISGTVLDLAPGGAYAVCAYKDSRTSTLWGCVVALSVLRATAACACDVARYSR